jgi:hypothetical protein
MNERIRELAHQARQIGEYGNYGQIQLSPAQFEQKFAELIVRECQTVVEWAISVDSTIDRVPVLIQEHFGVAE